MGRLIAREYQDERDQQIVFLLDAGRRMLAKDAASPKARPIIASRTPRRRTRFTISTGRAPRVMRMLNS